MRTIIIIIIIKDDQMIKYMVGVVITAAARFRPQINQSLPPS